MTITRRATSGLAAATLAAEDVIARAPRGGTPFDAFQRFFSCNMAPAERLNWSGVCDPALWALLDAAVLEFDETKRATLLARAHEIVVDNAYWLWVVHDVNPRALCPEVQGFAQAKSWYQDLTQVTVGRRCGKRPPTNLAGQRVKRG